MERLVMADLVKWKSSNSWCLKKYAESFPKQTKLCVRFSLNNLRLDDGVLNIPLYMADVADQLIGMALDKE